MNLAEVMDEIGKSLTVVEGLRIYAYPTDSVEVPGAVLSYPESLEFDKAMARGTDGITMTLTVVVGRLDARSSRDDLGKYCDGSGPRSIKAAIAQYDFQTCSFVRPARVDFDYYRMNDVNYLAAYFLLEIAGPGSM